MKYFVTKEGKIIRRLTHGSIVRMREKLKKFKNLLNQGRMDLDDI